MSVYGRIVAAGYDRVMARSERTVLQQLRRSLLLEASGAVLEIGAGTGANLPFYPDAVKEIVLTEPEPPMASKLARRLATVRLPARIVVAPAERLPFDDGTFDFVVSTLALCTVQDLCRSLEEIRRVLKRDGRLLFLEHVCSDDPRLARWQDRLERISVRIGHGCHCNRRTTKAIHDVGFSVLDLRHDEMRGMPRIVRPLVLGTATSAAPEAASVSGRPRIWSRPETQTAGTRSPTALRPLAPGQGPACRGGPRSVSAREA